MMMRANPSGISGSWKCCWRLKLTLNWDHLTACSSSLSQTMHPSRGEVSPPLKNWCWSMPSMMRSAGGSHPAHRSSVGNMSVTCTISLLSPTGTLPGHRIRHGVRIPPSAELK